MLVCVETSGTCDTPKGDYIDWITLSPKDLFSKKKTLERFKYTASEIKCVVTKESDIDYYIKEYYTHAKENQTPFIIQPVDGNPELVPMILKAFKDHNMLSVDTINIDNYDTYSEPRIMIQQHKVLGLR
jgi:organic radical activating enzyme